MFCPVCRDEFRPGFTRCANCDVDLVERLDAEPPPPPPPPTAGGRAGNVFGGNRPSASPAPVLVQMAEYCGFLSLDEARDARDRLRREAIRSEIVIREPPGTGVETAPQEEYWLRVERERYRQASAILGFDEAESESGEAGTLSCGECGADVAAEEAFCPKCGARFEDE